MDSDLRVCAEAATLAEARQCCAAKKPDVIVIDPEMEKEAGFRFVEETRMLDPRPQCVAFGGRLGRARIERLFKLGAMAVISQLDSGNAILHALYSALRGVKHMSATVAEDFCSRMAEDVPGSADNPFKGLSMREKQIFRLIGKGLRIKEVAAQAGMSARTVESHEANIKKKLDLRGNAELRRLAILFVERETHGERRMSARGSQEPEAANAPKALAQARG